MILGNGFSIDLIHQLNLTEKINLCNLFEKGENVPWPGDDKPAFLSYKYVPHLWTLGAHPSCTTEDSNRLIQEVITCANMLMQAKIDSDSVYEKIHIQAFKQLESYLMSLFGYYTTILDIPSRSVKDFENWGWYKYIKQLYDSSDVKTISVISLNYDIWLEQLLELWGFDFSVSHFQPDGPKIRIFKPHGSIGIKSKIPVDKTSFIKIETTKSSFDNHKSSEFEFSLTNYSKLSKVNAMIPPAGDSARIRYDWADEQRQSAIEAAKYLSERDLLILCGLSYWAVDRGELDQYLASTNPNVNSIMLNPDPPQDLVAVMMTLFDKFTIFSDSNNLCKI